MTCADGGLAPGAREPSEERPTPSALTISGPPGHRPQGADAGEASDQPETSSPTGTTSGVQSCARSGILQRVHLQRRRAKPSEQDWLFDLHEAAMRDRAEAMFGPWDRTWQREHFDSRDPSNTVEILVTGGKDVGAVHWRQTSDEIYLELIEVFPSEQGHGVGEAAVRSLAAEAAAAGRSLTLRVNKNNRAQSLYKRIGFEIAEETKTHLSLRLRSR